MLDPLSVGTGDPRAELKTAFDALREILAGKEVAFLPQVASVERIAARFELDEFSRGVLLLAAFSVLEPDSHTLIAKRQGPLAGRPTAGLALSILPGANWAALTPEGPLRQNCLIDLVQSDAGTFAQTLVIDEAVLASLVGSPSLSRETLTYVTQQAVSPGQSLDPGGAFRQALSEPAPLIQLNGPVDDAAAVSRGAAFAAGLRPIFLSASNLPTDTERLARLAAIVARDAALVDALLIVEPGTAEESCRASVLVERFRGPVVVLGDDPVFRRRRHAVMLDLPFHDPGVQLSAWCGKAPLDLDDRRFVERMAYQFSMAPERIADLREAHFRRLAGHGREQAEHDTWNDARRLVRERLDGLATRVESGAVWHDLLVPRRTLRTLKAIEAQVSHKAHLASEWGFQVGDAMRGGGLSVLFAGPSGTGKTLAAEILARSLSLDLYRIDLSAVMSKWVGETEKHLRKLFDAADAGGAILLFDEADALFGKRSEVRDSHDRYANVGVSYLLQRLEAYRGLAVLTTNFKRNIDEAFLRRLRFVVEFPYPEMEERLAIWRRSFPRDCPVDQVDFARLARMNATGGEIRNIALNAAYLAASRGGAAVTMADLKEAAELEREKSGKTLTPAEKEGWIRA